MENKFAKKKKLVGTGVCVRGRGVSGVGCGSSWEWAWVGVFFCLLSLFCVVVFVSYVVSCFLGFCSSFLQNFIKFKKVLFPNFSRATVLFGGFKLP